MSVTHNATLHHTCILVRDIEKSAEKLAKTLSVTWGISTITPEHCFVYGKPSPFSFQAAMAQVGDSNLELISPHSGNSVYGAVLEQKGEGFHHTCFTYSDLESMQSARDELKAQGHQMIQHGYTDGEFEFCYFELKEGNMVLELLYLPSPPPPEITIS